MTDPTGTGAIAPATPFVVLPLGGTRDSAATTGTGDLTPAVPLVVPPRHTLRMSADQQALPDRPARVAPAEPHHIVWPRLGRITLGADAVAACLVAALALRNRRSHPDAG